MSKKGENIYKRKDGRWEDGKVDISSFTMAMAKQSTVIFMEKPTEKSK